MGHYRVTFYTDKISSQTYWAVHTDPFSPGAGSFVCKSRVYANKGAARRAFNALFSTTAALTVRHQTAVFGLAFE